MGRLVTGGIVVVYFLFGEEISQLFKNNNHKASEAKRFLKLIVGSNFKF